MAYCSCKKTNHNKKTPKYITSLFSELKEEFANSRKVQNLREILEILRNPGDMISIIYTAKRLEWQ